MKVGSIMNTGTVQHAWEVIYRDGYGDDCYLPECSCKHLPTSSKLISEDSDKPACKKCINQLLSWRVEIAEALSKLGATS